MNESTKRRLIIAGAFAAGIIVGAATVYLGLPDQYCFHDYVAQMSRCIPLR